VDALGRRTAAVQTGAVFARYPESTLATRYGYNDRSEVTSAATSYGSNPDDANKRLSGRLKPAWAAPFFTSPAGPSAGPPA
jgi:hypothetical protein